MEKKVSDTIKVKLGEDTKEIKMSYGLIQTLCGSFINFDQVGNFNFDMQVQKDLISEVLDDRDENFNRVNPNKNYAYLLDNEEGEKLTRWISDHIANFFISRLEAQTEAQKVLQNLIDNLSNQTKAEESKQA